MTIRRFLSEQPEENQQVLVTGEELHHLRNVNRAQKGDSIEVINGAGFLYYGEIRSIDNRQAVIDIISKHYEDPSPVRIVIAPSMTKKKAMLLLMEKLTEMGVDEIRPIIFGRTDEKYSHSMLDKWNRIAMQALKVNKRLWPTEIHPPIPFKNLENLLPEISLRLLLDIDGEPGWPGWLELPVLAVIGPPGGILSEEREAALSWGFKPFRINDSILKTETAAVSIAALLKFKACMGHDFHDFDGRNEGVAASDIPNGEDVRRSIYERKNGCTHDRS